MISEEEDDERGGMRLAGALILLLWAVFGCFVAWVWMSLVGGGIVTFLEAFAFFALVSFALFAPTFVNMDKKEPWE